MKKAVIFGCGDWGKKAYSSLKKLHLVDKGKPFMNTEWFKMSA